MSRAATGFWGIFACIVATYAVNLGSLIEVVNRFGSFFYGSILGVFLLAMIQRARALGAFVGLIAGMVGGGRGELRRAEGVVSLAQCGRRDPVVVVGMLLSALRRSPSRLVSEQRRRP